ncbi:MAG: glycosyltransferase [Sinimarinibacterium flocculans]|uniref:glycosyltransferase n=1 Tax=Sinimarinibacterium flocculans TaxID=985250 RepID=UPI003C6BB523
MRVLSIIHYPVFGGPHNRNTRLSPVMARRGVQTTVLLPDEPGNAADRMRSAGVDVVQLPLRRLRASRNPLTHFRFMRDFRSDLNGIEALIRQRGIDVVQINGLVNPHGAIAARRACVPVVWQILDTFTPVPLRRVLAPVVRHYADAVMCTGRVVAKGHPGCVRAGGALINFFPPVDLRLFAQSAAVRREARLELGIDDASLVVGTVGNVNPQKGHDSFIRAAAELRRRAPDCRFLILGASYDVHRAYREGLLRLATELGLEVGRDLLLLDPKGQVHRYAQAMDIFWMTPRPQSEGIPTSMEEAMALGLPVVSFDVGSIGELIQEGRSGFVIAEQDPVAVADVTVARLLDAGARTAMGLAGRDFVERHASLEQCADRHVEAYEAAIRGHSRRTGSPSPDASSAGSVREHG